MTDLIAIALGTPFNSFEEASKLLKASALRGDVRHLSYWYLNLGGTREDVVWLSTYDPSYMSAYMTEFTPQGDPGISDLLNGDTVIDWNESIDCNPVCRKLYLTASRFGISRHGVSFAFRDRGLGTVVFSVNVNLDTGNWAEQKALIVERYQPFAHDFHERMRKLLTGNNLQLCA